MRRHTGVTLATRVAAPLLLVWLGACGTENAGDPSPSPSTPSGGSCSAAPVGGTPTLTTTRVASGLSSPVDLQVPAGDRARLFVVEQGGRIRIVRNGAIVSPPFLDVASRISTGGERGLLGLAFHPRYSETGRFFVNYTDRSGDTRISEFRVSANPDLADASSERELLFVRQPFANHNGGGLAFGNDGFLYIGLGDGGSGGDPQGNGQNLQTPLGKMLRIDVNAGSPFGVPADNPFLGTAGAFAPVWARGLRNPWRFSFDSANGDLYIGDVGQNAVEEIDYAPAGRGGQNYGWNVMEGSRCFRPSSGCPTAGLTLPVAEYDHGVGCSVTGGIVYRGCRLPGYHGTYFYGDYCTAVIRSFRIQAGQATEPRDWTAPLGRGLGGITSFGRDAEGEVYIVDPDGEVYKIVPAG
jgi:glucose/arabinose dehydrogenase